MITPAKALSTIAAALLLATSTAAAEAPADQMAAGKTEADLGHYDAAARSFTSLADATGVPDGLRAEALVRLGSVRRAAGDHEAAVKAFERAAQAPGLSLETKALLVTTL